MSPGARRPRTFQCREQYWDALDSAAQELGQPIDALIEEAMLAYAKSRGHLQHESAYEQVPQRRVPPPPARRTERGLGPPSVPQRSSSLPPPPPNRRLPTPPPRMAHGGGGPVSSSRQGGMPASVPQRSAAPRSARLLLHYEGQVFEVDKERFIVGRSKQLADMRLADSNVSREHVAIERVGQSWYLVDLGSTNGVHVRGERISRHPISDGDVIAITTHQIHCQLR